jgi:hypothetical protein
MSLDDRTSDAILGFAVPLLMTAEKKCLEKGVVTVALFFAFMLCPKESYIVRLNFPYFDS